MTREDAIKKVRSWNLPKETREILEALAPELRESEDERIRKHLVAIVEMYWGKTNDPDKAKDLAYLERLKECVAGSSKTSADEDERIRKFLLDYAIEMIAGLESDISRSIYDGIKGHDPESEEELAQWQKARAYLEKQKEPHFTKRNALFDKCVENCDPEIMQRVSDEVDEMLKEQKPVNIDYISGIREELLSIENNAKDIDGLTDSQWVAIRAAHRLLGEYVEQKEQKPLSTEETELNSLAFLSQMGYTCIPPKKEHQRDSGAPKNALGGTLNSPSDKDKNLDDIAQDYVETVKEYNPEPTWDLMQTAVCYGYHYREEEEQKPAEWKDRPANWDEKKEVEYQYEMSFIPKPEKPTEWSENDTVFLNDLI